MLRQLVSSKEMCHNVQELTISKAMQYTEIWAKGGKTGEGWSVLGGNQECQRKEQQEDSCRETRGGAAETGWFVRGVLCPVNI